MTKSHYVIKPVPSAANNSGVLGRHSETLLRRDYVQKTSETPVDNAGSFREGTTQNQLCAT